MATNNTFRPYERLPRGGVKSWIDNDGNVISNRKYQERYGSVQKSGFTTIKAKAQAKVADIRHFDQSQTIWFGHDTGVINDDNEIEKRAKYIDSIDPRGFAWQLVFENKATDSSFSTFAYKKGEIDPLMDELRRLADKYGITTFVGYIMYIVLIDTQ